MKLDIQLFGGRGASSSPRTEKLNIVANNENLRISFNDLKIGDTFKVDSQYGGTYNLEVRNRMPDGSYYVEGRKEGESGSYIGSLVQDRTFENANAISKQFMIPLSRTSNWRRGKRK